MEKFLLLPILALSLVSFGEKEKFFYTNTPYTSGEQVANVIGYIYNNEQGLMRFVNFRFIFLPDRSSTLTYDVDFSTYDFSYRYKGSYTYNYTDYLVDNLDVYFFGDDMPYMFDFGCIGKTNLCIYIEDDTITLRPTF